MYNLLFDVAGLVFQRWDSCTCDLMCWRRDLGRLPSATSNAGAHGWSRVCHAWRCRPVIRFGKCGSLAGNCICSSINALPICSLACRSISLPTRFCW